LAVNSQIDITNDHMKIQSLTPPEATLKELGRRLALVRKQQGLTQPQLAGEAGIGVATLRRIEDGRDAQLGSWIKLLKALNLAHAIDALLPETLNSPMAEAKASRKKTGGDGNTPGRPQWGDER
jgi:transcriptional regulator with XRE-family HTH domain